MLSASRTSPNILDNANKTQNDTLIAFFFSHTKYRLLIFCLAI